MLICRGVREAFKLAVGSQSVSSPLGRGTTFSVFLAPLRPVSLSTDSAGETGQGPMRKVELTRGSSLEGV